MPRIPVHTVDSAPQASRDILKALEVRFGRVLNVHGEMAHSPVVLHGYAGLQGAIREHGTFDARTRETIALAVGSVDGCTYCQAAHTAAGRAVGLTDDQMLTARNGTSGLDARLDTLLALAREYAAHTGTVPDHVWDAAREAGWTDVELAELSVHVTVNLLTNYFNHYVETDLDLPAAPAL
jgi:AhpD family alkylhydroperoxidase